MKKYCSNIFSFNKNIDVRTFVKSSDENGLNDNVENNNDDLETPAVSEEFINVENLAQQGAPTYVAFKTKEEYITTDNHENQSEQKLVNDEDNMKVNKLKSLFSRSASNMNQQLATNNNKIRRIFSFSKVEDLGAQQNIDDNKMKDETISNYEKTLTVDENHVTDATSEETMKTITSGDDKKEPEVINNFLNLLMKSKPKKLKIEQTDTVKEDEKQPNNDDDEDANENETEEVVNNSVAEAEQEADEKLEGAISFNNEKSLTIEENEETISTKTPADDKKDPEVINNFLNLLMKSKPKNLIIDKTEEEKDVDEHQSSNIDQVDNEAEEVVNNAVGVVDDNNRVTDDYHHQTMNEQIVKDEQCTIDQEESVNNLDEQTEEDSSSISVDPVNFENFANFKFNQEVNFQGEEEEEEEEKENIERVEEKGDFDSCVNFDLIEDQFYMEEEEDVQGAEEEEKKEGEDMEEVNLPKEDVNFPQEIREDVEDVYLHREAGEEKVNIQMTEVYFENNELFVNSVISAVLEDILDMCISTSRQEEIMHDNHIDPFTHQNSITLPVIQSCWSDMEIQTENMFQHYPHTLASSSEDDSTCQEITSDEENRRGSKETLHENADNERDEEIESFTEGEEKEDEETNEEKVNNNFEEEFTADDELIESIEEKENKIVEPLENTRLVTIFGVNGSIEAVDENKESKSKDMQSNDQIQNEPVKDSIHEVDSSLVREQKKNKSFGKRIRKTLSFKSSKKFMSNLLGPTNKDKDVVKRKRFEKENFYDSEYFPDQARDKNSHIKRSFSFSALGSNLHAEGLDKKFHTLGRKFKSKANFLLDLDNKKSLSSSSLSAPFPHSSSDPTAPDFSVKYGQSTFYILSDASLSPAGELTTEETDSIANDKDDEFVLTPLETKEADSDFGSDYVDGEVSEEPENVVDCDLHSFPSDTETDYQSFGSRDSVDFNIEPKLGSKFLSRSLDDITMLRVKKKKFTVSTEYLDTETEVKSLSHIDISRNVSSSHPHLYNQHNGNSLMVLDYKHQQKSAWKPLKKLKNIFKSKQTDQDNLDADSYLEKSLTNQVNQNPIYIASPEEELQEVTGFPHHHPSLQRPSLGMYVHI